MPRPTSLTPEILAQILNLLDQAEALMPASEDLRAADRQSKRKMGPENAFVVEQMAGIVRQTTDFLPRDFDDAGFLSGAEEQGRYATLEQRMLRLTERTIDGRMVQGEPVVKQATAAYDFARKHKGVFLDENLKKIVERRKRAPRTKPAPPATS
jgi:hypothetical protein